MTSRVAIIGAGITGLVCARELERSGAQVTVFEAADHVGGPITSIRRDGFLAERGPHTLMESNPVVTRLIDELGLSEQRTYASEAAHTRYMVRDGRPCALPHSPPALLGTSVFSRRAKLAIAREPFVPRRDDGVDESVTMFVRRRLNQELLDYGVELLVNGVWAGDPSKLSARYAFPKMTSLERDHGSLVRGAIARAREASGPRPRMFAFRHGNETLCRSLRTEISDLRLNAPVQRIERVDGAWRVADQDYDHVVLTVGARAYESLQVVDEGPIDFGFMGGVNYPWLSIVTLGFRAQDVAHPLDGFGMIVPIRENFDVLGALFTSTLFPGRAPDGHVTIACFVGGTRRPDLATGTDEDRLATTMTALRTLLGVRGEPVFVEHVVWEQAIPQYEVGYGRTLALIEALEHRHRGLRVAGNLRGRVAVPDLIEAGADLAHTLTRAA